ncbi:MAG: recombinase family protein, partial [Syntrophomonadaceae bacterium]|nr:recombinase family protein [Syntrophomonadaceae bacterium]
VERYDRVQEDLAEVNKTIEARNTKRLQLQSFIKMLKKQDGLLTEFDEELWYAVVDKLMVCSSTELTFIFKDGTELPWTVG